MHVRVGGAGPDRGDDLGEITGRELLRGHAPCDDVVGCDSPGHGPTLRTLGGLASRIQERRGRVAKPDDDAAVNAQLGDMDVGLLDRTLKSAIRQLILDGLIVLLICARNSPLATVDTEGTSS
jgi:hypothetical protein